MFIDCAMTILLPLPVVFFELLNSGAQGIHVGLEHGATGLARNDGRQGNMLAHKKRLAMR